MTHYYTQAAASNLSMYGMSKMGLVMRHLTHESSFLCMVFYLSVYLSVFYCVGTTLYIHM